MWKSLLVPLVLVACGRREKPDAPADPLAGIELATVPAPLAEVPVAQVVVTSKTSIAVDGRTLVPITNGKIDPSEKEGGERGRKLLHVEAALTASSDDMLVLAVDRSTPYGLLVDEMFTAKAEPLVIRRFAIVAAVKHTNARTALILKLPDMQPAAAATLVPDGDGAPMTRPSPARVTSAVTPRPEPLRLVVAATPSELLVWSFDGTEGTLQAPKLRVARTDPDAGNKIRTALAEIVGRRFGGHLPEDQREIVFMASDEDPAAMFIPVMAAMHTVVPDIVLATGFE